MTRGTVAVRFTGDIDGLSRDMETLSGKFASFGKKAALAFAAVTAGAAVMAVKIGKDAIDAASDLNESMSKVNVVFGQGSAEVVAWSKTAATALGMSQQKALEAAGTFGNFLTAMGNPTDAAQEMSTALVGLASDLASFNNANPEDVLLALRSGLAGEAEPLRKFGVSLSAARIEAEGLKVGITKSYNEMSAAQKSTLAYQIIMTDTATAQGDFARTSGGLANQQRILSAQFEDVKAKLGQALLPIMVAIATFLTTNLIPAFDSVAVTVAQWWPEIVAAFESVRSVVDSVVGFVSGLLDRFRQDHDNAATAIGNATSRITELLSSLRDMFSSMFGAISAIVTFAVTIISDLWDRFGRGLVDNLSNAFNAILTIITGAVEVMSGIFDLIKAILTGKWGEAWDAVKEILAGVWDAIRGIISLAIEDVRIVIETTMGLISAIWSGAWHGLATLVTDVWDGIKKMIGAAVKWVLDKIDTMLGPIDEIIGKVGSIIGGGTSAPSHGAQNIGKGFTGPKMARGGIVTRPTLALIGEAGPEAVVPLSGRRGAATATIPLSTLNPADLVDGRVLVAKLVEFNRRNGPINIQVA